MENIHDEAILGMLSEVNDKVDKVSVIQKEIQKSLENQKPQSSITKEDTEEVVKDYAQRLANIIGKKHKEGLEKLENLNNDIRALQAKLDKFPQQGKISLDPIMELLPKQKKIVFWGFEFLRSSVIITALILLAFFSLTLNIKQMDDYRALKNGFSEQSEYIRKIQDVEKQDSLKASTKKLK